MSDQQTTTGPAGSETSSTNTTGEGQGNTAPAANLPTSQEELDRVIESRLARERKKYGDVDELRTKASEFDKLQASMLSDQEKAVKSARAEATEETAAKYRSQIAAAEVRAAAANLKFRDPGDALAHVDLKELINGDGADTEKVTAALNDLAKNKPYLLSADEPQQTKNRARGIRRSEESKNSEGQNAPKKSKAADLLRAYSRGD